MICMKPMHRLKCLSCLHRIVQFIKISEMELALVYNAFSTVFAMRSNGDAVKACFIAR